MILVMHTLSMGTWGIVLGVLSVLAWGLFLWDWTHQPTITNLSSGPYICQSLTPGSWLWYIEGCFLYFKKLELKK